MDSSAGEEALNGPDGTKGKKDGEEYDLKAMESAEKNPNEMGDKAENQSPKKQPKQRTGKGLNCEVVLLDGEQKTFELDRNAEGRDLLEKVCQHLDLIEKDYFGIQFVDDRISKHMKCWLSPDKKITKQKKGGPWLFDFALKFYPPDPTQLRESLTRWLVVLQTRRDILSGKLPTTFLTQAMLGSYCVQADVGDFDHDKHIGINYIRDTSFAPNQTADLLGKITELHKQHKGQTPDEAENNFLENAKKLSMYGVDLHAAQDANDVDIMLGVCASGLQVYRDKLRISRFVWPKILKICYKRRHFYVKVRPTENMPTENTFSFKLASHRLAKRLWKICVEHHAFFRLREAEQSQNPAMFPRLGSKFRYSGRTLYQTRQNSQILDRPDPYFERSQPARNTFAAPTTRSRSVDELSNRPDYWNDGDDEKGQDGRDKKDLKDDPYATVTKAGREGTKPLGSEDGGTLEPGANKSMDGRDRLDHKPGDDDATLTREGAQGTAGLTSAELQKKAKEEEKERKKREKEEEKRRKKEEEERKKAEKAAAKKGGKGKDPLAEDGKDALAGKDNTEKAPGWTPGSHGDHEGTRFKNRWRSGQDGNQRNSGRGERNPDRAGSQSGTFQDGSGKGGQSPGRLAAQHGRSSGSKQGQGRGALQHPDNRNQDGRSPAGKGQDRKASADRDRHNRSQGGDGDDRDRTGSERDGSRELNQRDGSQEYRGPERSEDRDRHMRGTDLSAKQSPWKGKDHTRLDSGGDRHVGGTAAGGQLIARQEDDIPDKEGQTHADMDEKVGKNSRDKHGKDQERDTDKHDKNKKKGKDDKGDTNHGKDDKARKAVKFSKGDDGKKGRGKEADTHDKESKDRDANRYRRERESDSETTSQDSDDSDVDKREEKDVDKHGKGEKDKSKGKGSKKAGKDRKDKDKDADRYDKDADRHGKDKDSDKHGKDSDKHGKDSDKHGKDGDKHGRDGDKHGRHGKDKDADRHGKDKDSDKHGRDGDKHGRHGKDKDADRHGKDSDKHGKDSDKHGKDADKHGNGADKHGKGAGKLGKDGKDKHGKDRDADKYGKHKDADKHGKDGKDRDADKHGKDGDKHGKDSDKDGKHKDADKHGKDGDKHGKDGKHKDADKHGKDGDKHGKDGDKHGKDKDADKHGKDSDKHGKDKDADKHGKDSDKHGKDSDKHGKDGKHKDADKHGKDSDKHGKDKDTDKHGKGDKRGGGFFGMFKKPRDTKFKSPEDDADPSWPGSSAAKQHRKDKSKRSSLIASLCPGQSPSKKETRKSSVSSDGGNIEASGKAEAGDAQNEPAAGSAYPNLGPSLLMGGGDMSGVVGEETWIDNKVTFEPLVPPKKETKDSLKSGVHGIDHTMPFFSPDATSTVGRPGKVPPPIHPKVNSSDDSFSRTDVYKNDKDGIQQTRVQHKMVLSSAADEDFDYDAALADAIHSVTEFNPDITVERIECVQQIEDVKGK